MWIRVLTLVFVWFFFIISVFPIPKEEGKYNYVSSEKDGDNDGAKGHSYG